MKFYELREFPISLGELLTEENYFVWFNFSFFNLERTKVFVYLLSILMLV